VTLAKLIDHANFKQEFFMTKYCTKCGHQIDKGIICSVCFSKSASSKKYELIPEGNLFRLKALRSFNDVKAGDLGGLVSGEHNLSHDGDCWVYETAQANARSHVTGNALVSGDAKVFGSALISGDAEISGQALISGSTSVFGKAQVFDDAWVRGSARVYDRVMIFGNALVSDDVQVFGKAQVSGNAQVTDFAQVSGNAQVTGSARVSGNTKVSGDTELVGAPGETN
jgi:carbonic anhydrase/acetyltransferase-like protein (isoleucine patch superfamily)